MIGKDFWEDADIDATVIELEIEHLAKELYKEYQGTFTDVDCLQMNNPINDARSLLLKAVLEHIKNDAIITTGKL